MRAEDTGEDTDTRIEDTGRYRYVRLMKMLMTAHMKVKIREDTYRKIEDTDRKKR